MTFATIFFCWDLWMLVSIRFLTAGPVCNGLVSYPGPFLFRVPMASQRILVRKPMFHSCTINMALIRQQRTLC